MKSAVVTAVVIAGVAVAVGVLAWVALGRVLKEIPKNL